MGKDTIMRPKISDYRRVIRFIHNGDFKYVRGSFTWDSTIGQGRFSVTDSSQNTLDCVIKCSSNAKELGSILERSKSLAGTSWASRRYFQIRFDRHSGGFRSV